jgi:iron-sulfur cluster repair protein YtfE (RIC family)
MKATTLLERQHSHVKTLFHKLESKRMRIDPAPVLEELANALAAHMAIEQRLFYPAIREVDEDLVFESLEEHALAEIALKRLLATSPDDPSFHARVTATKELIEHHVKEEEEDLFPKVEKALDEDALADLGKRMKALFEQLESKGHAAVLPEGFDETSSDIDKPKTLAA